MHLGATNEKYKYTVGDRELDDSSEESDLGILVDDSLVLSCTNSFSSGKGLRHSGSDTTHFPDPR